MGSLRRERERYPDNLQNFSIKLLDMMVPLPKAGKTEDGEELW